MSGDFAEGGHAAGIGEPGNARERRGSARCSAARGSLENRPDREAPGTGGGADRQGRCCGDAEGARARRGDPRLRASPASADPGARGRHGGGPKLLDGGVPRPLEGALKPADASLGRWPALSGYSAGRREAPGAPEAEWQLPSCPRQARLPAAPPCPAPTPPSSRTLQKDGEGAVLQGVLGLKPPRGGRLRVAPLLTRPHWLLMLWGALLLPRRRPRAIAGWPCYPRQQPSALTKGDAHGE
nr:early growth response protein 4-like [Equus asinus]